MLPEGIHAVHIGPLVPTSNDDQNMICSLPADRGEASAGQVHMQTRSLNPDAPATIDAALRDIQDNDGQTMTIMQDVLEEDGTATQRASLGPLESKQSSAAWLAHDKLYGKSQASFLPLVYMSAGTVGGPHCMPSEDRKVFRANIDAHSFKEWHPDDLKLQQPDEVIVQPHYSPTSEAFVPQFSESSMEDIIKTTGMTKNEVEEAVLWSQAITDPKVDPFEFMPWTLVWAKLKRSHKS